MGLASVNRSKPEKKRRGGLSSVNRDARLTRDIRKLEEDVDVEQEGNIFERASRAVLGNFLVKRVLDVVSRPNYAVAGAYEEIVESAPWRTALEGGPPSKVLSDVFIKPNKRIAREIFSGVGPVQGEKQGFGEVFQDLGYGPGGSLSGLAPGAFSETGEGFKFQRGGFFDWTARGSLGLALDIVADPTTYLTFGTAAVGKRSVKAGAHYLSKEGIKRLKSSFDDGVKKGLSQGEADSAARELLSRQIDRGAKNLADKGGVKLFGVTLVPGEVIAKPARNLQDAMSKYLHSTSLGRKIIETGEGIGQGFRRDFRVRSNPEYIARKQLYLTELAADQRAMRETFEVLHQDLSKSQRNMARRIEDGKWDKLDGKQVHVLKRTKDIYDNMAKVETDLGLLDNVRTDYVFHAFDAPPQQVKKILARFEPSSLKATLKGSQKARQFDTIAEAEKALAKFNIKPIEDNLELLIARGNRHLHAVHTHKFFTDVANRWGIKALPDEMEAGAAILASELSNIRKLSAGSIKARVPFDEIRKLSDEGKKEFLRREFSKVADAKDMEDVMTKYKEFQGAFPETTDQATRLLKSHNGEPMERLGAEILDIPEFKDITLPSDLADDIRNFNKSFINKNEAAGMLRAYDKFMNAFKVGVTVIFPAFQFRNGYSNLVQQFTDVGLSAINPAIHADAVRILGGDVNGSFIARHGRRWGYSEVAYEAKRRGVIADYRNIFETVGDKIPIRTGKGKALDFVRHPITQFKQLGGIIENEGRLALFTNYLRRGLDPETASQRVNKVLFDYKNLAPFERDVLTRFFPFYRWTRKNLALQAERLLKNPGQAATQAKLTRQNSTDPKLLPKYLRGEFVFNLGTDETGKLTTIRGIDLPITDLNMLDEPFRAIITQLAPLPKVIGELGTDKDWFRDRTISENSNPLIKPIGPALDFLPQHVKKMIDFNKKTKKDGTIEYRMNPTLTYVILKSYALSRLYGTAERMLRAKSLASPENFLDLFTGIRLQDVDADAAARRLDFEYKDFLSKKALSRGDRKKFTTTFKPKEKD
jgi:hypothetical protein